jgi:hypothetical protein
MFRFIAIGLVAAACGCFAFALATTSACVTAPPPELPQLAAQRPTILHDAVVPPTDQILAQLPEDFIVPVQLDDPDQSFEWDVFVDYNPCADPNSCQPSPPAIYPQLVQPTPGTLDGGVALISFPAATASISSWPTSSIPDRPTPGTASAATSSPGSTTLAVAPTAVRCTTRASSRTARSPP